MKQEDIVALARAGFTREQIVALAGLQQTAPIQQTVPVQQTAPIQQTVPDQQTAPVQQTVPVQQTAPVQQTVPVQQSESSGDPVLDALLGLRDDMKKQALLFSSQPANQTETTNDILASIINPKGEK
jgi:hypothetical protein